MPTFLLRKYDQENPSNTEQQTNDISSNEEQKKDEGLTITVSGAISEIVAMALQKALQNKVDITEISEKEEKESTVKAITTESINKNPLLTFESIRKNDVVFIYNKGFNTTAEEWFLTNIPNKTSNVFYTLESFIRFIKTKF